MNFDIFFKWTITHAFTLLSNWTIDIESFRHFQHKILAEYTSTGVKNSENFKN